MMHYYFVIKFGLVQVEVAKAQNKVSFQNSPSHLDRAREVPEMSIEMHSSS